MSKLELQRKNYDAFPIGQKVIELKESVVGPPSVTTRINNWRESLRTREVERTLIVAAQSHLVVGIDEEAAAKTIEERLGQQLNQEDLRSIFAAGKRKRIKVLPPQPISNGRQIEMRTLDGDEAARTAFDPQISPEELEKTVIVIGYDKLLSKLYEYENWPGRGSRSFTEAIIDGKAVPLWRKQGREIFPRPPQEGLNESITKLSPGETIHVISADRKLRMDLTALPLKSGVPMPWFVLAVDHQKAPAFGDTIDHAREEGLGVLWIVDHSHEGLLEAALWKDVKDGRRSLLDKLFRRRPARYRVYRRSPRGWLSGMDETRVRNARWVPEDAIPGCVDVFIEAYDGKLEEVYIDYMSAIAERENDPSSEDRRIQGITTVGLADIKQRGISLKKIKAEEVMRISPAPPLLTTFKAA